jgi:hypothetical protein
MKMKQMLSLRYVKSMVLRIVLYIEILGINQYFYLKGFLWQLIELKEGIVYEKFILQAHNGMKKMRNSIGIYKVTTDLMSVLKIL